MADMSTPINQLPQQSQDVSEEDQTIQDVLNEINTPPVVQQQPPVVQQMPTMVQQQPIDMGKTTAVTRVLQNTDVQLFLVILLTYTVVNSDMFINMVKDRLPRNVSDFAFTVLIGAIVGGLVVFTQHLAINKT